MGRSFGRRETKRHSATGRTSWRRGARRGQRPAPGKRRATNEGWRLVPGIGAGAQLGNGLREQSELAWSCIDLLSPLVLSVISWGSRTRSQSEIVLLTGLLAVILEDISMRRL